ncbi:MAG: hypothetical protein WCT32_05095 [Patescibacteria group bacterium]|jgi:hypothetical protein
MVRLSELQSINQPTPALMQLIDRLCARIQPLTPNELHYGFEYPMIGQPFFYVTEIERKRLFRFIPLGNKKRLIMAISSGFFGEAIGKKEVRGWIGNKQFEAIIREEFERFACDVGASSHMLAYAYQ